MKEQLDDVEHARTSSRAAEGALARSGLELADVSFLCALHTKRSMHDALCAALGVDAARAEYLDDTGHMSGVDTAARRSTGRCARASRDGDVVLLLAAGTGYTWAASVLRWGPYLGVKAALVTGAAGGIGNAIVERLEADGWSVHGVDLADADLTTREGNRLVVDPALERFGRIDAVVANAGFQHVAPVADFPEDEWDRLVALLLTSPFLLAKYAWPALCEHGDGRFVAVPRRTRSPRRRSRRATSRPSTASSAS